METREIGFYQALQAKAKLERECSDELKLEAAENLINTVITSHAIANKKRDVVEIVISKLPDGRSREDALALFDDFAMGRGAYLAELINSYEDREYCEIYPKVGKSDDWKAHLKQYKDAGYVSDYFEHDFDVPGEGRILVLLNYERVMRALDNHVEATYTPHSKAGQGNEPGPAKQQP